MCAQGSSTADDGGFDWCGGWYSETDLTNALSVLQRPYQQCKVFTPQHLLYQSDSARQSSITCHFGHQLSQPLSRQQSNTQQGTDLEPQSDYVRLEKMSRAFAFDDAWLPDSWACLGTEAITLLTGFHSVEIIPWVCAALRFAELICNELCWAGLGCAVPYHAESCCAMLCHAVH